MNQSKAAVKHFRLPDLGEGLQEVEIVEWRVTQDDTVDADQALLLVETAKAIVEVPSPRAGKITQCIGKVGDIVAVGSVLVEFSDGDAGEAAAAVPNRDAGTVVGTVESSDALIQEQASTVGRMPLGMKATPAVRALAKRLDVDLAVVTPSGPDGLITMTDVQRVGRIFAQLGALEPLRGVRRAMARNMTLARDEVVPVTVYEDADVDTWRAANIPLRLIHAIIAGCRAEPALNAWYDTHSVGRRLLKKIDLGIAVDTEDGLFVPLLHDVGNRSAGDLNQGLQRLKANVRARTTPPEEMRGATFTLSNFGAIFGRYANPIVQPPTVGILGAGAIRAEVRAHQGAPQVRRVMPLSLTFDHRAVTGGEAARFLKAVVEDLQQAE